MHRNLRSFLDLLRRENDLVTVNAEVDPYLEVAEIHRRVIERGGPALVFTRVKKSAFPVVTNLFGTKKRIELAFGPRPEQFVKELAGVAESLLPLNRAQLWQHRSLLRNFLKLGTRTVSTAPVLDETWMPGRLGDLPVLTTWDQDGGPFITLPLVYTEHPTTKKHNLGIYRMQVYSAQTAGLHWQIQKGGGFHYHAAEEMNEQLPVTVFLGGPPALIVSAIAPLPEDVPELMLASLLMGEKLRLTRNRFGPMQLKPGQKFSMKDAKNAGHRLVAEAEFALMGHAPPHERLAEGPFGDHYGYYSLKHAYPVFYCDSMSYRRDAIYPATVVGKPKQEDFFLGDYLQSLLSPIFPIVMPSVRDLWSYGETGFHSLAAAVVRERYTREALAAGFRILGEGQLSLTKFLMLTDSPIDLHDFRGVLEHILARVNWQTDFFIFSNTSMDTLDYTSGKVNEGSKAILMGLGDAIRELPGEFHAELPAGISRAEIFCRGCLVLQARTYLQEPDLGARIARHAAFGSWPLVVLHDDAKVAKSVNDFLWSTWTRFEPAGDIYSAETKVVRHHLAYRGPIVIDARKKPSLPDELIVREDIAGLVDRRWLEYFPA